MLTEKLLRLVLCLASLDLMLMAGARNPRGQLSRIPAAAGVWPASSLLQAQVAHSDVKNKVAEVGQVQRLSTWMARGPGARPRTGTNGS